jgi:hypothetical protein
MSNQTNKTNKTQPADIIIDGVLVLEVEKHDQPETAVEEVLVESTEQDSAEPEVLDVQMNKEELKAAYAVAKEEAKLAHDPLAGKFKYETFAEYKTAYNAKWELAHPNDKDALPSTDAVLQTADDASAAVGAAVAAVKAEGTVSKMTLAKAIFQAEFDTKGAAGLVRKDILKRFIAEAGCTAAGANTYYNTIRDKAGLVNHKV